MKLHNSTKLVEPYKKLKNIKQAIQKETRKTYWTYMKNNENQDITQKQKENSGIKLTQERTTLEFHPLEKIHFD